ncbi:uncharacterized protein LOC110692356 [Chenopodium quinoa]|uniref:uncharacterized protein LOC110692356 n=1 Tax=Chenopodium quinoa TaxID=63459 RepID=UPI000B78BBC5|nr:uncharacterized protein LOC110692356 [Chenopodium quinoa]
MTQRREGSDGPMFVKDLWENQRWNLPTLRELFSQREIDAICSIPVPILNEEDSWSWHHTKDGLYSVKSAYNFLIEEETRKKATSSECNVDFNWKHIWHACIPPKIKLFAWRCVREGLTVMSRLLARGLSVDQRCPMCGEDEENTAYPILFCPAVSSIWRYSVLRLDTKAFAANEFREWCNRVYGKIKEKKWWDIFWCLAWGIWLKRNSWVFDRAAKSEEDTIHKAMCLVGEFEAVNASGEGEIHEQKDRSKWKVPSAGLYKLNSDVAFQESRMGIGGILRDEEGDVVVTYCSTMYGNFDVAVGEAVAMRSSLITAMEAGFRNLILETDISACSII